MADIAASVLARLKNKSKELSQNKLVFFEI